jgi:hypothetical protein
VVDTIQQAKAEIVSAADTAVEYVGDTVDGVELQAAPIPTKTPAEVEDTTANVVDYAEGRVIDTVENVVATTDIRSTLPPTVGMKASGTETIVQGADSKIFSPDLPSFRINPNRVQPTNAPVTPNEMPTVSIHLSTNPKPDTSKDLAVKSGELLDKAKTAIHDFAEKNPELVKKAEHLGEQGMSLFDKARGFAQKAVHKIEEGIHRLDDDHKDKNSNDKH